MFKANYKLNDEGQLSMIKDLLKMLYWVSEKRENLENLSIEDFNKENAKLRYEIKNLINYINLLSEKKSKEQNSVDLSTFIHSIKKEYNRLSVLFKNIDKQDINEKVFNKWLELRINMSNL